MDSLIIDGRISGFFSNYLQIIDNLKYCEINNLKPILRLNGFIYTDGRNNIWEYYFKKINDGVIEGNVQSTNFFKVDNYILDLSAPKSILWNLYENGMDTTEHRIFVNEIIKKNIFLKPSIENEIEKFKTNNFKGKVIGIHIRGTDYGFYDLDKYVDTLKKYEYDSVYIATDNNETIEYMKKNIGNICYYNTDIRMDKLKDVVLCYKTNNKLKHGEDVLIESYLLSNCDHLICINSNVPLSALYINPHLSFDMIYRAINGG